VASNTWLFGGLLKLIALRKPRTAPLLRTTTAVTVLRSGSKKNLVPQVATAWLNHRVHPTEAGLADVLAYDRKVIGDKRVKIEYEPEGYDGWLPPAPVSSLSSAAFIALKQTIADCFEVPTAPLLMTGNTDTKHYWKLAKNIYRFTPVMMTLDDLKMFHGVNERITLENLSKLLQYYVALIERCDSS
ncbi:unnamed protein product, partial [Polarella glacialis]